MGAIGRPSASSVSVPKFSIGTADRFAYMGQYVSKRHAKSSSYFGQQSPGPATYNTRTGMKKGVVNVSDTSSRTPPSYSFGGDVNRPSPFRVGFLLSGHARQLWPPAFLADATIIPKPNVLAALTLRIRCTTVIAVSRPSLLPTDGLV